MGAYQPLLGALGVIRSRGSAVVRTGELLPEILYLLNRKFPGGLERRKGRRQRAAAKARTNRRLR